MGKVRFSESTQAFFPYEIPYNDFPKDIVDVPLDDFYKAKSSPFGSKFSVVNNALVITEPSPHRPTLDETKSSTLDAINARCAQELAAVRSGYPDDEVQSWAKQEAEARSYGTSPTPLLSALSAARGIDLEELVAKVIAKSDAFATVSGTIIGTRQACEDAIDAAETVDDAQAVVWPL